MKTPEKYLKDCNIQAERLQQEKPMLYANILKAIDQAQKEAWNEALDWAENRVHQLISGQVSFYLLSKTISEEILKGKK